MIMVKNEYDKEREKEKPLTCLRCRKKDLDLKGHIRIGS
jgi:hypothetical protein